MPKSKSDGERDLVDLVRTSAHIVDKYQSAIKASSTCRSAGSVADLPHPLQVLRDAAKLLQAHMTKLSLLLINKPFTPSAVAGQIRGITETCLPAMMSAVDICTVPVWGRLLRSEVVTCVEMIMREMHLVLRRVAVTAGQVPALAPGGTTGADEHSGRDTLESTGVLWEACDRLIRLEQLDVGGLALRKAQEYHDQLKDAIEELKEWSQSEDDDGDDEEGTLHEDGDDEEGTLHEDGDDGEAALHDDGSVDDNDMFSSTAEKIPKNQVELKALLTAALDRLKKTDLLCTAIEKRRLKTFTKSHAQLGTLVEILDAAVDGICDLSENVDDLANAFYELDTDDVESQLDQGLKKAKRVIGGLRLDWNGQEDEFTAWSDKWIGLVTHE